MYKLKLIKGCSFIGFGKKVASADPFIEVDIKEESDNLMATGRFALISAPVEDNGLLDNDDNDSAEDDNDSAEIEKMTEKQLDAYAAESGIDLAGTKGKTAKLAKIQEALAANDNGLFDDSEE